MSPGGAQRSGAPGGGGEPPPGKEGPAGPAAPQTTCRFRVSGHLSPQLAAWFDGLTITNLTNGEAALEGPRADQAALHGVLLKLRDLNLPLLSLRQVRPGRRRSPDP